MSELFPFVQFEFSHNIGPPPGRYVLDTTDDPSPAPLGSADVLVVRVDGATPAQPRRLGRQRARPEGLRDEPRELAMTVATVIKATEMQDGPDAAQRLLSSLQSSPEEQERWIQEALAVVNRAIAAYRACAADPYAVEVSRADAFAVRIGHGPAAAVSAGSWDAAISIPQPQRPRVPRALHLLPTQGMAAVLSGRARRLESEDLILRAVLDLEHGRPRAAAAGLRAAHELLAGELGDEHLKGSVRERFDGVLASRAAVCELAERAATQALADADARRLAELAEEAGALVDAWRYQPVDG